MRNNTIGRCLVRVRRTWRDLIFRAIVFLALALVAFSFSWHDTDHKQENNSRDNAENRGERAEERLADYTLWLDWATFGLFASTVGLWIVTWRSSVSQSKGTQRSLAIASRAADAAHKSADVAERALRDLERPYVVVKDVRVVNILEIPGREQTRIALEIDISNLGRTPAIINQINIEIWPHQPNAPRRKPFSENSRSDATVVSIAIGASDMITIPSRPMWWRGGRELDNIIQNIEHDIVTIVLTYEDLFGWMNADKFRFYFRATDEKRITLKSIADSYSENRKSKKFQGHDGLLAWSREWPEE
jgi:hypothetical protein